jgi:peroxygenase
MGSVDQRNHNQHDPEHDDMNKAWARAGQTRINDSNHDRNHASSEPQTGTFEYFESRHPLRPLTTLQKHVLFWDRDLDGVIWPHQIYYGFRELGFSILFSLGALLIPFFFSYPTRFRHSIIPDPFFRIYMSSGSGSIHGSDTGIYNYRGEFSNARFEEMWSFFDRDGVGGLTAEDLLRLLQKNRCAHDPAGWCFAFMEWWTTWLLMQEDGRVWKEDVRSCYDGTLFFRIADETRRGRWTKGYGVRDFLEGMWKGRTWRVWEIRERKSRLKAR